MNLGRDFLSTSALTPATAAPIRVATNGGGDKKNAEGAQSRVLEPSQIELWQAELAREASNDRGIDALHRILTALKSHYAEDETGLLDAIDAMRDCAERHLDKHECETIDAIFRAVFSELSRSLDDRTINLDAEQEIQRLAALPLVQYERERTAVAERLGLRTSILDSCVKNAPPAEAKGQGREPSIADVEPWHESVSAAEILQEAATEYARYLILPEGGAEKMALWSLMTHCFDCFAIIPRLAVTAADKECAKSLLLRILKCTSARAVIMTNANIAPLFRVISSHRPAIFLDEADNYIHDSPQLLALLNDGYAAGGCVWRCEGDGNEVREFDVFAPVAIAMIERPPATLLSRSIEIRMKRKKPGEKTENFRGDRPNVALQNIQRKFARIARDHAEDCRKADPGTGHLFNRDADNWRPIFAIADLAGGEWSQRVREIAAADVANKAEQSTLEKLLHDIRWLFDLGPDEEGKPTLATSVVIKLPVDGDAMTSADMADQLVKIEGRPWADWKGKSLTQNSLARLLARVSVQSGPLRLSGDRFAKGYKRSAFDEAFARHLPPQSVTASQPNNHGHCDVLKSVTTEKPVTLSKASQPNNPGHCDAVTLSNPARGQMGAIDL